MGLPEPDRRRDLEVATAAHRRLVAEVEAARAAGRLDPVAASRLPDWTVGHVLTHLARNADSHRRMIEGADRGEVLDQYVGGAAGRERDIERGAGRSADEIVADVVASVAALEAAWAATGWAGAGRRTLAGAPTDIAMLPFLRAREAWVHLVDLGLGVEFTDVDPRYLRLELARCEMSWKARQPMGLTPLPGAVLALPPATRLAWFLGRAEVDGLPPAGIF